MSVADEVNKQLQPFFEERKQAQRKLPDAIQRYLRRGPSRKDLAMRKSYLLQRWPPVKFDPKSNMSKELHQAIEQYLKDGPNSQDVQSRETYLKLEHGSRCAEFVDILEFLVRKFFYLVLKDPRSALLLSLNAEMTADYH